MSHFGGRSRCSPARVPLHPAESQTPPAVRRPTHEEIARRAYAYWEAGGRRESTAVENWLRAERDLNSRDN